MRASNLERLNLFEKNTSIPPRIFGVRILGVSV